MPANNNLTLPKRSTDLGLPSRVTALALAARSQGLSLPARLLSLGLAARSFGVTLPARATVQLPYLQKALGIPGATAYWPLGEASGATINDASGNGRNGTYSNVTLGQAGIGDGQTSAQFGGSNSVANVFSASFQAAFNPRELTIAAWAKVQSSAVWTDGLQRNILSFGANSNNRVEIYRNIANNLLGFLYVAGGTFQVNAFSVGATLNFFHVALTVSKSNNRVRIYINGVQQGADLTGLGNWAGNVASTECCVGIVTSVPTLQDWKGYIQHPGVWGRELAGSEIAALATVP